MLLTYRIVDAPRTDRSKLQSSRPERQHYVSSNSAARFSFEPLDLELVLYSWSLLEVRKDYAAFVFHHFWKYLRTDAIRNLRTGVLTPLILVLITPRALAQQEVLPNSAV